jgi:hypothetical protein
MAFIVADEDDFLQLKESKKQYSMIWLQFRDFVPEHDSELAPLLGIPSPCFSTF